jgi:hypothetical protein
LVSSVARSAIVFAKSRSSFGRRDWISRPFVLES